MYYKVEFINTIPYSIYVCKNGESHLSKQSKFINLHLKITEKADKATLFQYGPFIGRLDFREALAKFLSEQYKHDVNW